MVRAGDRGHVREARDPGQHPVGEVGVHPHPLPLGAGQLGRLRPDLVGHADPADVVEVAGSAYRGDVVGREAELYGGRLGERGHVAGVAERERALEVDEVADRGQQVVEAGLVQPGLGVGRDRPAPGPTGRRREPGTALRRRAVKASTTVGSRWPPRRLLAIATAPWTPYIRWCTSATSASWATRISIGISLAGRAGREPAAVVALEGVGQRPLDLRAEADVPGQGGRRGAVGVDQRGELAACVPHQRRHHAHPLRQRLAACDVAEQEPQVGQPGPVDEVGVAADRDVVAEPAGVLLGVRMAPDPHEQRRVVDRGLLLPAEAEPVRQPARDDRRPEHVLGRLTQAEVDRHRQPGEHLDPTRQRHGCGHCPILVPTGARSAVDLLDRRA